jgi:hypothetical protein
VQIDTEVQVKKDFDSSQQPEDIHEEYFEKDDKSSAPQKFEIFRGDLETIRSEATTDGECNVFISDDYIQNCSYRQNGRK